MLGTLSLWKIGTKKRDKKRKCRNINPARKEDKLSHDIPGTNTKESIKNKLLSETILEFAQPLMDKCENADQQKKLIDLSVLAWNMSYLPEGQQEKEKEKIIKMLGDDAVPCSTASAKGSAWVASLLTIGRKINPCPGTPYIYLGSPI